MKKFLLSLLTLIIVLPAFPQQLKKMEIVGKPRKMTDGELITRKDGNGRYCAAIKFVSDMDGFSYDSWDGIVDDVKDQPGQDIVFVTPTERVVEIFKTGYEPLKIILADLGIILQPQDLWQIKIAGDEAADVLPVTFRFTPEDAKLFIDSKEAGNKLTQELSVGEHKVRLIRDGYQSIEKTINVNKQQVFFQWQMEEAPDAGVQIITEPSGATVYLDGVELGETPVAVFYPPGTYPIKISKKGYVSIENETLEITLPQTVKKYTLEENVGYLTINTRNEATVYFNGEKVDNHTRAKLSPQLLQVKVTMPKADDLEEQVVIKKDDDIVLDMYPDIQTGTLQVAVTPFDANIELAGDAGEHYTAQGMKIFNNIPVGTYTLKVTAEGHITTEETIILQANEKLNKSITLEEGSDWPFGIEMIFVKGGTFNMGCTSEQSDCGDDEKPVHRVTVNDFYISKHEITVSQFKEFIEDSKYKTTADQQGWSLVYLDSLYKKTGVNWESDAQGNSLLQSRLNYPVIHISWFDAIEYCKWLSRKSGIEFRLPTEAEWEYAARGGEYSLPTEYSGSLYINLVGWCKENSESQTHPVGQLYPNELGIYDMSGNAAEWCGDWYTSDYYNSSPQYNPLGSTEGVFKVLRGGSCFNIERTCSVSNRNGALPFFSTSIRGFSGIRIARSDNQ